VEEIEKQIELEGGLIALARQINRPIEKSHDAGKLREAI
jgi:hypothetical protein